MKNCLRFLILIFAFISLSQAGTFVVTNTKDAGSGSFREALTQSNTQVGADTIVFEIPQSDPGFDANTGVWTIPLQSYLPDIRDDGLLLDGLSQSDFIGNETASLYAFLKFSLIFRFMSDNLAAGQRL